VKLELLRGWPGVWVAIAMILFVPFKAHAILKHPDKKQVEQALERGVVFAREHRPPNELYWHFGSTKKFEPQGFLVTKISGLAVMSGHYALRGEQPTDQDIQQVLGEGALQVVVTVFGNSSDFAQDSYLLLKQDDRMIKPDRIRFDARARAVGMIKGNLFFVQRLSGFSLMARLIQNSVLSCWSFQGLVERADLIWICPGFLKMNGYLRMGSFSR